MLEAKLEKRRKKEREHKEHMQRMLIKLCNKLLTTPLIIHHLLGSCSLHLQPHLLSLKQHTNFPLGHTTHLVTQIKGAIELFFYIYMAM